MEGVDNALGCTKDGVGKVASLAKLGGMAKADEAMARSVFARFQAATKKKKMKSPFVPPPEKNLFQYSGHTDRHLRQDLVASGVSAQPLCDMRRGRRAEAQHQEQLGPPRRRPTRFQLTQPQTARDYLLAACNTAQDKNLARVAEVEAQRLQDELHCEKAVNTELESQLQYHEAAFQEFLQYHYHQVSDALMKGDTARRNLMEQEIRIDYFSGLLTEAQTVQEEEEERLQELTAFQQFLAAVTPSQSLKDLKRRMQEIQDEIKASHVVEDSQGSDTISCSPVDFAQAASLAASDKSEITSPIGEGSGGGTLGANLLSLRMMKPGNSPSRSPSRTGHRPSQPQSPEGCRDQISNYQNGTDTCDAGAFDEFLDDDGRLVALASMYESQCHALLALLTRLRDQTEAINKEVETRQKKLGGRLEEIKQLQEKARGGGHEDQLRDLHTLIAEWPRLSGDAEAQNQLDQLVAQIAEVVSDVFGSSKYSPLVPQMQKDINQKQAPKSKTGSKTDSKDSPTKETPTDPGKNGPTVSAGMGQEALLALLEARVTDLCAQLDTIEPELRDSIFMNCEQARRARLKEEKRQEAETRRAERKQRHLERAMAEPPSKPL